LDAEGLYEGNLSEDILDNVLLGAHPRSWKDDCDSARAFVYVCVCVAHGINRLTSFSNAGRFILWTESTVAVETLETSQNV